jgi:hypothetical protein
MGGRSGAAGSLPAGHRGRIGARTALRHVASIAASRTDWGRPAASSSGACVARCPRLGSCCRRGPFLVAVATLTLLAECAGENGLVCFIDDAQWADSASLDTLEFVARRLDSDAVALIFAARDGDIDSMVAPKVAALHIAGLAPVDAADVLAQTAPSLAEPVARRLIEASGGNPLALLEIPAQLTLAQQLGEEALPEPLPVGFEVQRMFAALAVRLPEDTQVLLALAPAEDTGRVELIGRAAEILGVDLEALSPAEEAGLVRVIAGRVEFRHPLVRSAVYQQASFAIRRAAHRDWLL